MCPCIERQLQLWSPKQKHCSIGQKRERGADKSFRKKLQPGYYLAIKSKRSSIAMADQGLPALIMGQSAGGFLRKRNMP
jgi:hypothetical protein